MTGAAKLRDLCRCLVRLRRFGCSGVAEDRPLPVIVAIDEAGASSSP